MEEHTSTEYPAQLVYCLSMDLIGSTQAGLEFITTSLEHFNRSLVEQIKPHLQKLGLTDALLKQSTMQVQVNVIHKSVGQITESDVLLASASNAIIIGFQVRPSMSARKLAEQEQIDIRLYSIIYNAINELKSAIEGMLAPEIEEKIICNLEIRDVFKITKVGTVAGCMVLDGKITRNTMVRLIRDGIVVYSGELGSLKRFKDDAKEVSAGYECGLNIANFNDIKAGDIIEGYETVEVKRKL